MRTASRSCLGYGNKGNKHCGDRNEVHFYFPSHCRQPRKSRGLGQLGQAGEARGFSSRQERWTGTRQRPAGLVSLSTLGRVVPEPPGLALLKVRRDCDWNKADEMEQSISAIKGMKASNEVTASCLPTWLQERMAVWCSRGCSHLEPSRSDSRAAQSDACLAEVQRWAICFLGHQ